jgi:hypothetical protein
VLVFCFSFMATESYYLAIYWLRLCNKTNRLVTLVGLSCWACGLWVNLLLSAY